MSQSELLKRIVLFLDSAGIDYLLTGSLASSLQGEPRSTHDIDIVLHLEESQKRAIANAFGPPDYYTDLPETGSYAEKIDMFNLIDVKNGDKIDFWIYTDDEFDRSRFSRKYRVTYEGVPIFVSAPEDTIIAKLRWSKLSGGGRKQCLDALRVFEIQKEVIDTTYLGRWVEKLELKSEWDEMLALAK